MAEYVKELKNLKRSSRFKKNESFAKALWTSASRKDKAPIVDTERTGLQMGQIELFSEREAGEDDSNYRARSQIG